MTEIDAGRLRESWAGVAANGGDTVAHWFYAHLFLHHPETRGLFAPSMDRQRDRLVRSLGHIVSQVDQVDDLLPYLQDLGRDHRKFGALADHYPAVGESLLATVQHFSGASWSDELAGQWSAAYRLVSTVMIEAAGEAARHQPAYWNARVTSVDRRTFDIAVVKVVTSEPYPYRPGQSCSVELSDRRPRMWRWLTPANAPGSTELEFHVRLVSGGPVSTALVRSTEVGDSLRIGPPAGRLTLDGSTDRPLLLIAGGTGLAPMKALVAQLARDGTGKRTSLYFGASTVREAYDSVDLERLNTAYEWLDVVTVVSDDPTWDGPRGLVGEVAMADRDWSGHDVYVCGSPAMVAATVKSVEAHGVPGDRVRYDEFSESS